jgi:osmoprotectant transport system substrate-binding protein
VRLKNKFVAVGMAAALGLTLTACGSSSASGGSGGGSSGAGASPSSAESLKGASFNVGSKDFTESILLGKITEEILKDHGASVNDKTNIKGSVATRTALTSGDIDMYWEYTGTAWITYQLNTKPISDPVAQYNAVKTADAKAGIAWLAMAPMNDTYAFAYRASAASDLNVKTLSDLAALSHSDPSKATFCIESEFSTRDDGFPGVVKAYGISAPASNVKLLDTGVIYTETAKGSTCNFGEVFATDGRIAGLKLTVLQDDKNFFPNYNAAMTLKQSELTKYPALATIFAPVSAALDNATMTALNAKVDVDGDDPGDVAKEWVDSKGFNK